MYSTETPQDVYPLCILIQQQLVHHLAKVVVTNHSFK